MQSVVVKFYSGFLKTIERTEITAANSGFASAGGDPTQYQLPVHYSSSVASVTERR